MPKQVRLFCFVVKKNENNQINKISYCYGDTNCTIYKSGTMNITKSPHLINIFMSIIDDLCLKFQVHLISKMSSIVDLNMHLLSLNIRPIRDVIDIDSCSIIWKLYDNFVTIPLDHKEIYIKYVQNTFHKENYKITDFSADGIKKLNKHDINILSQGMSYAIEYPLDAKKIVEEIYQIPEPNELLKIINHSKNNF